MAKGGNDGGGDLAELAPAMLEAVPYVGRLVGTLARAALAQSEQEEIRGCLIRALRIDDTKPKRALGNVRLLFSKPRALHVAQRQAVRDLSADMELLDAALLPADPKAEEESSGDEDGQMQEVPNAPMELAQFVYNTARQELNEALNEGEFIPWPSRLANALTTIASTRWEVLKEEESEERDNWARLIVGHKEAKPRNVNSAALVAFGQRVGLRFEVNMMRNQQLQALVLRLDRCDQRRAEALTLSATQGIRTALILVLFALVLLFGNEVGVDHVIDSLF